MFQKEFITELMMSSVKFKICFKRNSWLSLWCPQWSSRDHSFIEMVNFVQIILLKYVIRKLISPNFHQHLIMVLKYNFVLYLTAFCKSARASYLKFQIIHLMFELHLVSLLCCAKALTVKIVVGRKNYSLLFQRPYRLKVICCYSLEKQDDTFSELLFAFSFNHQIIWGFLPCPINRN